MKPKVADTIRAYLSSRPLLLKYSVDGLVNVASLARKIKKETGLGKSDEAFIVYLHRFLDGARVNARSSGSFERVMAESTISVRTGFAVLVKEGSYHDEAHAVISFGKTSVVIDEERALSKHANGAKYYRKGLVLLEIRHGKNIEEEVGTIFHMLSKFAERDIGITEVFSAYDATYLLVDKKHYRDLFEMFLPLTGESA